MARCILWAALLPLAAALRPATTGSRRLEVRRQLDITNRGYVRVDSEKETVAYPKAAVSA